MLNRISESNVGVFGLRYKNRCKKSVMSLQCRDVIEETDARSYCSLTAVSQLRQTDVILPTTSHIILNPLQPITKTRLYNFDPLKPHFYIIKLGFTGVYIIFLILLKQ